MMYGCGQSQLAALLAVLSRENLKIVDPLKTHLEHVEVVIVVFDIEHFGHVAVSIFFAATLVALSLDHLARLGPQGR